MLSDSASSPARGGPALHHFNIYDLIQLSELIAGNQFLDKGDVNSDGEINNEDIFYLINLIF